MPFDPNAYDTKPRSGGGRQTIQPGKHRVTIQSVTWDDIKAQLEVTFAAGDATIRGWYPAEGPRAWLLASLLVGSIPGIIIGSRLAAFLPERAIQVALAIVLAITGSKLLIS